MSSVHYDRDRIVETALTVPRPPDALLAAVAAVASFAPLERMRVIASVSDVDDLARADRARVERMIGRRMPRAVWDPRALYRSARFHADWSGQATRATLWIGDPGYPDALRHIYDPPIALFVRGDVSRLATPLQRTVAVVGTRNAARATLAAAEALGHEAAAFGLTLVSGLATGIDQAAHSGTLIARGPAVCVLGAGIDSISPMSARTLARGLLRAGGAVVSEYPPGVPGRKHHFPARNRIIAGLSALTVLVEAPARSGALITADYCLQNGRAVYVHRAGVDSAGCAALVAEGATVIDGFGDLTDPAVEPGRDHQAVLRIDPVEIAWHGPAADGTDLAAARRQLALFAANGGRS